MNNEDYRREALDILNRNELDMVNDILNLINVVYKETYDTAFDEGYSTCELETRLTDGENLSPQEVDENDYDRSFA